MFLRQSTSQVIRFGPCLDATDGVTEETALTLAQADMRLSKDGGAFAQKSAAGNATHDSDGWYDTTLSTTDVNTVGELRLNVHQPANMLPVWDRWWVIEEAVYDLLYGAGATGLVTLAAVTHTGAVIPTVTTLTGHTAQTADHTAGIADIPTVAEFNARTLVAASYFDPSADAVANVTLVATTTTNTDQRGTDGANTTTPPTVGAIADAVADEVYTGATHNVVNSLARRIRELSEALIISTGTCDAAGQTLTNVRLESGESSVDQVFRHKRLAIIAGTNAGFDGIASNYDGTNKDLTISPALPEACDDTSDYEITPAIVHAETSGGGYVGGAVWYSNVVGIGTPGTEPYVNGTIDNPSNSITDTRTLLDALKLNIVHLLPGSSAILTQTWNNFEFIGAGYSLDLSDEDVGGCRFFGGSIFGTGTGSSRIVFRDCIHLSPLTVSTANWIGCNWSTTVTLSSAANYTVTDSVGTNAVVNFGAAVGNTNVNFHSWSGNIQIEAMGDTGTDTMFADMNGVFTEGTCTGGAVDIHGVYDTVGITNLTLSETRALTAAEVNTEVDTALSDVNLDQIDGRTPAVLVGGRMDSSVGAMATDVVTADAIATDAIGSSELAASAAQKIRDEILPTQNVAFDNLAFLFVAASDHVTPVTGATGTAVTRSIDGGAFGAGTGTLAEISNGVYQYDASAADMNGGVITFRFTGTGGTPGAPDDRFVTVVTGGGV